MHPMGPHCPFLVTIFHKCPAWLNAESIFMWRMSVIFFIDSFILLIQIVTMGKRNRAALLPTHLPQLQNLIKRDSKSYEAEFLQQWRHFQSTLSIFCLKPDEDSKELCELVTFMSQVAQCYPELTKDFSQQIVDLLKEHCTVLHPEVRKSLVQALILLRNKGILDNTR